MDEITPSTRSTTPTPGSPESTTAFPPPETKTFQLEDGTIRVEVGGFYGFVSSWHLVDKKEHELISAYRNYHQPL